MDILSAYLGFVREEGLWQKLSLDAKVKCLIYAQLLFQVALFITSSFVGEDSVQAGLC